MASPTVNVVRYTALVSGIFYGIAHRRTLQARENEKRAHHETERQEKLLERAREAWKEKVSGPAKSLITDPDDPKFDIDAVIAAYEKGQ